MAAKKLKRADRTGEPTIAGTETTAETSAVAATAAAGAMRNRMDAAVGGRRAAGGAAGTTTIHTMASRTTAIGVTIITAPLMIIMTGKGLIGRHTTVIGIEVMAAGGGSAAADGEVGDLDGRRKEEIGEMKNIRTESA
jgi:hypothetical protein